MASVVIALVSSAVALVVGSVLSKVYFTTKGRKNSLSRETHQELMKRQGQQYEKKYTALHNQARHKIKQLNQKIVDKDKEIARLLSEACDQSSVDSSAKKLVDILRAEIVSLRENLNDRDQRISELNLEIRDAQYEAAEHLTKLNTWKHRVSPLSDKLQQQQEMINSLENELTSDTQMLQQQQEVIHALEDEVTTDTMKLQQQREVIQALAHEVSTVSDRGNEETPTGPDHASGTPDASQSIASDDDNRVDDLKAIRGIGPALERRLRDSGIHRFRQLAEMSEDELADLAKRLSISPTLAARHAWIEQARALA